MLAKISIGWIWLEKTLNGIIDAVNQQKPIGSATIAVEESPNGSLLKAVVQPAQPASGGGGEPTGQWMTITIVDPDTCTQSKIQVWFRPVP